MEKFKFNKTEYDIIESYGIDGNETWQNGQLRKTTVTIVKTIFPFFPILKGKKFRWFKKCKVRYRLYFIRTKEFDDGYTYQSYWTRWKHKFNIEEIIN